MTFLKSFRYPTNTARSACASEEAQRAVSSLLGKKEKKIPLFFALVNDKAQLIANQTMQQSYAQNRLYRTSMS